MRLALAAVLALVGGAGCTKEDAPTRAAKRAEDIWPDAPPTSRRDLRHRLAYRPDDATGYLLLADVESEAGAAASLDVHMRMDVALRPAATPRVREIYLTRLELDMNSGGAPMMRIRVDRDSLEIRQGGETVTTRRGEPNEAVTVEGLTDHPAGTVTFGEDGTIATRPNADHLLDDIGAGDMFDASLVLLPDLPAQEIAAGHRWEVKRTIPIADKSIPVTFQFEYTGDGGCPSGAPTCAHLRFNAASDKTEVEADGHKATVTYGFAGKVFLDLARGTLDEGRYQMNMDARVAGREMPMGGVYTLRPLR